MPKQPTDRLCHERTPQRNLQSPYKGTLPCNKGGVCWLLLANTQGRCLWFHKKIQTMPRVCKYSRHPSWQSPEFKLPLILCHMGNEHTRTTAKGPRRSQIFTSRHRLLHQVDISKTTVGNYGQWGGEIHPETPYMHVQLSIRHCQGQWHSIQNSDLWRLLDKARFQAPCHLYQTSSNQ